MIRNAPTRLSSAACGLLAALIGVGASAQTITSLGSLGPNGSLDFSYGYGVNIDGTVVVGQTSSPAGDRAYYWTPAGMQSLGVFAGGTMSAAHGVSWDGSVVVGASDATSSSWRSFRYILNGALQDLNTGGFVSTANDVSANGNAVAGVYQTFGGSTIYRWTNTGGIQTLGSNLLGIDAIGISGDGSTVVGYSSGILYTAPIQWTQSGGLVGLPPLTGGNNTTAMVASYNGYVVAGQGNTSVDNQTHVVRWLGGGAAEDLGIPVLGPRTTAISADGLVLAGDSTTSAQNDAWIWSLAHGGFVLLSDYLASEGVNLTGWTAFNSCNAISADGTALVGDGIYQGSTRAFVVRGLPPVCGPWIVENPSNVATCFDGTVNLVVTAYGHSFHLPTLQWEKQIGTSWVPVVNGVTGGGTTITGANSYILTLANCATDARGNYRVVVTDGCASRATPPATVAVNGGSATFVLHPVDQEICPNSSATYSINYLGVDVDAPFTTQWERRIAPNVFVPLFDGTTTTWDGNTPGLGGVVSGATTANMTIAADLANGRVLSNAVHASRFRCVVSNACGGVVSNEASLKVWASCQQADINGDNAVNNFDIDPFVLALVDHEAFLMLYPDVNPDNADCNGDGDVNNFDIDAFVTCVVSGGCP